MNETELWFVIWGLKRRGQTLLSFPSPLGRKVLQQTANSFVVTSMSQGIKKQQKISEG